MPYKISGTKSETSRVIIVKESDWTVESNTVVSGSGAYSIEDLVTGNKLAFSRAEDGEIVGFGSIAPIYYAPPSLMLWGYNNHGQLGQGDVTQRSSPVQVSGLTDVDKVVCSHYRVLATKTDGTMWSWGYNTNGQLGVGDTTKRSVPVQIGALTDWNEIAACNNTHALATKTDGTLWAWGNGDNGNLGQNNQTDYSSPVQVGALTDWDKVGGTWFSSFGVKTDGTLWSWGHNSQGQLGLGDQTYHSSPVQVGALIDWASVDGGESTTVFALKTDGTLWGWGSNSQGILGLGDGDFRSSPSQVGALTNWSQVSCGYQHIIAVKTDGTLWSWGINDAGELGQGDIVKRSSPVQVGSDIDWSSAACNDSRSFAIKTDGTLWSWGYNAFGQLGQGDITSRSSPIQIGSLTSWTYVDSGSLFALGIA